MNSNYMIKSLDKKFLSGILALIFLLTMAMSDVTLSEESQDGKQNILRQASLKWMEVGIQQYKQDLFKEAERSFRRASVFRNFLTDAEREQLDEYLTNARIGKSEGKQAIIDKQAAEKKVDPNQPVKPEVKVEKVAEKAKEEVEESRPPVEEEQVQSRIGREIIEEGAKAEAQLQAQVQAYAALEEQLKAETQARLKAQQEVQAQTKARASAEEKAASEAATEAESYVIAIQELEEQLQTEIELKSKALQEAKAQTQARTIAEEKADAEAEAKIEAQKSADQEAKLRAGLEEQLKAETELRAKIEGEAKEALAAVKADAEVKEESYTATIKQTEQKLKVQTEEAAKAVAQLQAQAQAYSALEEQLKAETQARLKAQKEAQVVMATEPEAPEIQAEAESSQDVIVIKDKSIKAQLLRFFAWLSQNQRNVLMIGLPVLAVLVIISKLNGRRKRPGKRIYKNQVPPNISYIGNRLNGNNRNNAAIKDSKKGSSVSTVAVANTKRNSFDQSTEHWSEHWKELHNNKVNGNNGPSRINGKWPQRKDKSKAGHKHCRKCQETKSYSDFHKNKSSKDGLASWCKECKKQHRKKHAAKKN